MFKTVSNFPIYLRRNGWYYMQWMEKEIRLMFATKKKQQQHNETKKKEKERERQSEKKKKKIPCLLNIEFQCFKKLCIYHIHHIRITIIGEPSIRPISHARHKEKKERKSIYSVSFVIRNVKWSTFHVRGTNGNTIIMNETQATQIHQRV